MASHVNWLRLTITVLLMITVSVTSAESPSLVVITVENVHALREVQVLGRGEIRDMDWHPNGDRLAVATVTGLWLVDETLQTATATPIQQPVFSLAWSPDGSRIAMGIEEAGQCVLHVWNTSVERKLFEFRLASCFPPAEFTWSPDNIHLVTRIYENELSPPSLLINTLTGSYSEYLGGRVGWSPSGLTLLTRTVDRLLGWDVATGQQSFEVALTDEHLGTVIDIVDDDTLLYQCNQSDEQTMRVHIGVCRWKISSGAVTREQEIVTTPLHTFCSNCVQLLDWNDAQDLLLFSGPGVGEEHAQRLYAYTGAQDEQVALGYANLHDWIPHSERVTTSPYNGELRTYDSRTGELIASSLLFSHEMYSLALRSGSDEIATTGFGDRRQALVWKPGQSTLDPAFVIDHDPAHWVDYAGDELIVSGGIWGGGGYTELIAAFDPDTGERLRNIDRPGAWPDPEYVFWNSSYQLYAESINDRSLRLPSGTEIQLQQNIRAAVWSPDDLYLATYEGDLDARSGGTLRIWDLDSGEEVMTITSQGVTFDIWQTGSNVSGILWSSNNSKLALRVMSREEELFTRQYSYQVFDIFADERYADTEFPYEATIGNDLTIYSPSAAWSPDERLLAIANAVEIRIYDTQGTEEPLLTLATDELRDIAWSDDGRRIVGVSRYGMVHIWGVVDSG
jgi:WD40 repeat protein